MNIEVKDVNATLKSMNTTVNLLTEKLKDRNYVGVKRSTSLEERRNLLKNMVTLTASGLVHGLLDEDKYGMLRGNATKEHFKEPAEINKITKELMSELATDTPEDSDLAITELAKLIKSPYRYEEIVTKDGETIKVDSVKETIEIDGEVLSSEMMGEEGATFFEKVKNLFCRALDIVWSAIKKVAMAVAIGICFFGILVWDSIRWLYNKVTGLFRLTPEEAPEPQTT